MSSIPFSFLGTLTLPPDEQAVPTPLPFGMSGSYTSEEGGRLVLTGSGTKVVAFGSVGSPGVKGMLIEYVPSDGAAPVNITFNSGVTPLELSPGGFIAYGSPVPVAGITSLSIAHTTDCTLRVRLLG